MSNIVQFKKRQKSVQEGEFPIPPYNLDVDDESDYGYTLSIVFHALAIATFLTKDKEAQEMLWVALKEGFESDDYMVWFTSEEVSQLWHYLGNSETHASMITIILKRLLKIGE